MVYVDDLFEWPIELTPAGQARRVAMRNGGQWCHLIADTPNELLEFAKRLGLLPKWVQRWRGSAILHFDLTPRKRADAIALGAKVLSRRDFLEKVKILAESP